MYSIDDSWQLITIPSSDSLWLEIDYMVCHSCSPGSSIKRVNNFSAPVSGNYYYLSCFLTSVLRRIHTVFLPYLAYLLWAKTHGSLVGFVPVTNNQYCRVHCMIDEQFLVIS